MASPASRPTTSATRRSVRNERASTRRASTPRCSKVGSAWSSRPSGRPLSTRSCPWTIRPRPASPLHARRTSARSGTRASSSASAPTCCGARTWTGGCGSMARCSARTRSTSTVTVEPGRATGASSWPMCPRA